jgi:Fe-S cluster assembly iron-binding protein IscA
MKIKISDEARNKLNELMKESNYEEPALRLLIAGIG